MKKTIYQFYLLLLLIPGYTIGQQTLNLENCSFQEYEINDHSDSDDDGNVCEAKLILTNSAFYTDDNECDLSDIKWVVTIDLWNDGTNDLEFNSSLPSDDTTFDDTNNNGIPDIYIPMTSNNEVQNIQLPDIEGAMSNHKIVWNVSDDCDLGDLCVTNFDVKDKKAPTPYCVAMSVVLDVDVDTYILVEDFDVGSFDNCTEQENLQFSFSPDSIVSMRLVTCDDAINSPVDIRMYVWDENNNVDYCTAPLFVQQGSGGVDCFLDGEIAGTVKKWNDVPVEGVEITLDADLPNFPLTTLTNANGEYSFGLQESGFDYTLSASLDDGYLTDVSTLDLVLIVRHILGIQSLDNPYKILAADINGDNKITVTDILTMRKLILGIIIELSSVPPWRFLDAEFEFDDPSFPFPSLIDWDDNPYLIEFNIIDQDSYDFIGVKIGDVSN